MYTLKELLGYCVTAIIWMAIAPLIFGAFILPLMVIGLMASPDDPGIGIMFIVSYLFLLITVIMSRIYQIFEKWDQVLSVKNKSKFLDLGYDGIKLLKTNFPSDELDKLRVEHRNKVMEENIKQPRKT